VRHTPTGTYAPDQDRINEGVKLEAGYKCERCKHSDNFRQGYALTTHHLDGDKSNNERWNLAALCQKCHLHIQGKVFLPQFYMFEHSDWFKPHVEGHLKSLKERSEQ